MKMLSALLALGSIFAQGQQEKPPKISPQPLSSERIIIYQAFLSSYLNGGPKVSLNISQTTNPFNPRDYDLKDCLAGFGPDEVKTPEVHTFSENAFPGNHLVDPARYRRRDPGDAIRRGESVDHAVEQGFIHALFSFSEIVFDASHTHAAFSYAFVCGGLCGHGGTVVYELGNGKWKASKRSCGSWIS